MHDLIIIGSGPAGLVAGIYAGRFRLKTLILEKGNIGGQIVTSATIENFPGFPEGVSTIELINKFKKQLDGLEVPIVMEEVTKISRNEEGGIPVYKVKTLNNVFETKTLIVAAGAYSKKLAVNGEEKFIGRGVSYCGTCDGPFFKGKEILVVGGGDRAIEEAIFLTSYAKKVTLIHRRQQFRAAKILEEKAKENPKIIFMLNSVIEEIRGEIKVESVVIKNITNGLKIKYSCDGIFIFVGIQANTAFLKNIFPLDESGFIVTDQEMKTSLDGVFACGDCLKKSLYQVVNACGEAAVAVNSAHKYLLSLKG